MLHEQGANLNVKDGTGKSQLSWDKLLLDTGRVEADSRNIRGRSPLSWAAENGHEAVTKLLLDTGSVEADSRDEGGRSPLWWAVNTYGGGNNRAIARLLLDTGKVESVEGVTELLEWEG